MSGYNWEDGVGPVEERPKRLDLAWFSTETNAFGTNEFIEWCKLAQTEPMLYDLQDALMVGGALITLLNNSDRVKAACLAQLVNVIGAIFTEPGGAAWRQTIFHPFRLVSQHARGIVLQTKVRSTQCETKTAGTIDHIVASAVHDAAQRKVVLFVLNREGRRSK
jgi:alpha-L-arabinofuranosidase